MPSPNVLDLSPTPRRNQTGLERVIEGYAEGTRRNNEADELGKIYEKYKEEGIGIEKKIQAIRTNPKISPTAKTNAVSDLTNIHKINATLQNKAAQELKARMATDEKAKKEADKIKHEEEQDILENDFIAEIQNQDLTGIEIYNKALQRNIERKRAKDLASMTYKSGREERLSMKDIGQLYESDLRQINADIKLAGQDEEKREPLMAQKKRLQEMRQEDLKRWERGERNFTPALFKNHKDEMVTEELVNKNPEVAQIVEKISNAFPPSQWKGKTKKHKASGLEFKSNGEKWVLVEQQ